jgi:parallel beta-helix repeat protein
VIFCLAAPTLAGEGRIPIWQPITIAPGGEGKYFLSRDVSAAGGTPAIDILSGVGEVDIDLNGFTISAVDADVIRAVQIESLTVRNGTIQGGVTGIYVDETQQVVIEDVKAQSNGQDGFYVRALAFAIRRNIVTDAARTGIEVQGFNELTQGLVQNNVVRRAGLRGIELVGCVGCIVTENTVWSCESVNIAVVFCRGCEIYNNTSYDAGTRGIYALADESLILDNVSSHNTESGIVVSGNGRNTIERNVANNNGEAGIWIASGGNTFGRNTARGNLTMPGTLCVATPPPCVAPDICIDDATTTSFGDNMGPNPGC